MTKLFDIKTIAPTVQVAREALESYDVMKGYVTIEAKFSFNLLSGDMKAHWEVYHSGGSFESSTTVKAARLEDAFNEVIRRRFAEREMAPLSLPRVADAPADANIPL